MISHYSVNLQGPSHASRDIPCQDSCRVRVVRDGTCVVAAVADGLGSQAHTDVGSSVAAETAVSFVATVLDARDDELDRLALIRDAYFAAYDAVIDEADRMDESAGQFDCTLTLAILEGDRLWWGHSGDSGLMVAHTDGTYELVTSMQRDDEGRVYPLCFDTCWQFGKVERVASALLCTDGVLETIAPPVLAKLTDQPIDTKLARMFLHPHKDDAEIIDEVEASARAFWDAYPSHLLDDDKTVVVLFDVEHMPGEQDPEYYAGPNWDEVNRRVRKALYGAPVEKSPKTDPEPEPAPKPEPTQPEPAPEPEPKPVSTPAPQPVATVDKAQVADLVTKVFDVSATCAAITISCGAALGRAVKDAVKDLVAKRSAGVAPSDDHLRPHRRTDAR